MGQIAGARVVIDTSLLIVGPLLALVLADSFDGLPGSRYLIAGIFVVAFYASIFVHECAHLVMGRIGGRQAESIELMLFGGVTLFNRRATRPGQQFATAIVGPLASLLVGAASFALAQATTSWVSAVAWSLGITNVILGLFNLLPGLPLDGGHAMRAVVWKITGRETAGIRATAWIGRGIAVLLVLVTLWRSEFTGNWIINVVFAAAVAMMMWQAASMALRSLDLSAR